MGLSSRVVLSPFVCCLLLGACLTGVARAYITTPVPTLGAAVSDSTYVTVIKVEKVSRDKVLAKLAEVRDKLK